MIRAEDDQRILAVPKPMDLFHQPREMFIEMPKARLEQPHHLMRVLIVGHLRRDINVLGFIDAVQFRALVLLIPLRVRPPDGRMCLLGTGVDVERRIVRSARRLMTIASGRRARSLPTRTRSAA